MQQKYPRCFIKDKTHVIEHEKKHNFIDKLGKCQLKSWDILLHQKVWKNKEL